MKKVLAAASLGFMLAGCSWVHENSSLLQEAARGACIVAHAFLPDADILEKCQLAADFLPLVERLAGEQRTGVEKAKAAQKREDEKAGVCKPTASLNRTPTLYNSALQVCMGDLGYKAAYVDSYGVTQ